MGVENEREKLVKDPITLLLITLFVATVGMVLVILGTVHGALLIPGAIVLAIGLFGAAGAGLWRAIQSR